MKLKVISLFVCLLIITSGSASIAHNVGQSQNHVQSGPSPTSGESGGLADSPWPMFRQNLNHTGLSPYDTSGNNGQLKWSFNTGDHIVSSPAIDSDGTIYVGSDNNKLYAINPDGSEKWSFKVADDVRSSPAIGTDGTIYVGDSQYMNAINPDGTKKWSLNEIEDVDYSSPAIGFDGVIYVGCQGPYLYAIKHDGTLKWRFETRIDVRTSPAISSSGTIYFGSSNHNLYAINPDGTEKWNFTTGNEIIYSSPAIDSNGTIYIGSHDHKLYAINPDGTLKWSFLTGNDIESSPAIDSDGTIYVGSDDHNLYAINPDGTEKWRFTGANGFKSSPVIGSDGTIYAGDWSGNLYAVNQDGTKKWDFTIGSSLRSSPAIGSDGTIYIGSNDGKLYAIGESPSLKVNVTSHFSELNSAAQSAITVQVTYGTNPVQGATVTLDSDNGGIFSPQSGITDANGDLKSIFNAPTVTSQIVCRITAQASKTGYNDGSGHVDVTINPIPWPMFRQNLNHTGQSPYDTSTNNGKLKWSFMTGGRVYSSPAVGTDNTIYVGSIDDKIYALNPDGTEKWNFTTGGDVFSSPAIGSDGTIYIGSNDNNIYAINADGTEKWNFATGGYVYSSPAIGSDGTIYIGSNDNKVYAINPDGTLKWTFITGGKVRSPPAIGHYGTIYISSQDSNLYAINPNGNQKWCYTVAGFGQTAPAISSDGTIYWGSRDQVPTFHAINPDGTKKWDFSTGIHSGSAAIGPDGTIYFGSGNSNIYALNPDGSEKWRFPTESSVDSSPAIGSDGTIYVGSQDDKVYAINPNGSQKWNFTTGGGIVMSSPAIGTDGTIYIGSYDGNLYAIGGSTQNQPPIADAGPDQTINEGDIVQFDASSSHDPNGTIISFEWDFDSGDGLWWETSAVPDATGPTTSHIYGDDGIYIATLRITDNSSAIDTDTCIVTVDNVAPTIEGKLAQGVTEEWVARYNVANDGDWANAITVGPSGNAYVTGHSYIGHDSDYATVAYDPSGNQLWVARYDGPAGPCSDPYGDYPYDIVVDSSENIYVTGKSRSTGSPYDYGEGQDIATVAYDSNGNQLWVTRYNGPGDGRDIASAMANSPNGNIIVTGESYGIGTDADYVTIAYDSSGNQLWVARYNGPGNSVDEAWDIAVDEVTGNIYVTGRSTGLNVKYDYATVAYDSNGNELWVMRYDGPASLTDEAVAIAIDSSGIIYVTGSSKGVPSYNRDIVTIAYDSSGTQLWVARSDAGSTNEMAHDIAVDNSGRIYVAGDGQYGSDHEYLTVGYDLSGNLLWTARYDGAPNNYDSSRAITIVPQDLIFVTGVSNTQYPNYSDYATIIYDLDGNELFVTKYNGPGSDHDSARAMTVDSYGNVYVTGGSDGIGTNSDYATIKYSFVNYNEYYYEGSSISFIINASDPGSDDLTFTWDWGDGTSDTVTTYHNNGMNPESVYNPVLNEIKSPEGIYPFTAADTVNHIYGDDGVYTITLTVEDDDGGITTYESIVTVNNVAPTITLLRTYPDDEGSRVTFEAEATDPGSDDIRYSWDIEYGPTIENTYYNDWVGPEPVYDPATNEIKTPSGNYPSQTSDVETHVYGDNYDYTITLTVTDDDGGASTATTTVTVDNLAPSIMELNIPSQVDEGYSALFEVLASDQGSDDLTFTWDFKLGPTITNVHYNDGVGLDPLPSPWGNYPCEALDTVDHAYGDNGVYTLSFSIEDDDGGLTTYSTDINVQNIAPTIDIVNVPGGDEGAVLTFSSTATDPGSDDITFTWNWGDGSMDTMTIHYNDGLGPDPPRSPLGNNPFTATDTVSHIYGDDGNYTITLTIEDDDGGKATYTTAVIIDNVAPTIEPFGPFTVDEGSLLELFTTSTDPGSDDLTFTWDFEMGPTITNVYYNDGSAPDPYPSPWGAFPCSASDSVEHTYGDNGVYPVTLTVTDDDGGFSTYITNITVNNVAPTIATIEANMFVNFFLRVAGEKYHSVGIHLYEDDVEIWNAQVTRQPGSPDAQAAILSGYSINFGSTYRAIVDYIPNDPRVNGNVWGGNPVWVILEFQDGTIEKLHHTFNVRQSYWDTDHWNHIDPWEVDLTSIIYRQNITFEAIASDPGSDDLMFQWDFGDGHSTSTTHYNNGVSPDPYPSPDINPMNASDTVLYAYAASGIYTVTLTVMDDDGGIATTTLVIVLPG